MPAAPVTMVLVRATAVVERAVEDNGNGNGRAALGRKLRRRHGGPLAKLELAVPRTGRADEPRSWGP